VKYTLDLTPDDNDTYLVTCRELPEVTTFSESLDDATRRGVSAIEEALAARIADGRPSADDAAPEVGTIHVSAPLPALTELKVSLYEALRDKGITRAELCRRLDWKRESVDRLFRLDHASRLEQIEAAAGALGCVMHISLGPVFI
jgi:antitoxin HicB